MRGVVLLVSPVKVCPLLQRGHIKPLGQLRLMLYQQLECDVRKPYDFTIHLRKARQWFGFIFNEPQGISKTNLFSLELRLELAVLLYDPKTLNSWGQSLFRCMPKPVMFRGTHTNNVLLKYVMTPEINKH